MFTTHILSKSKEQMLMCSTFLCVRAALKDLYKVVVILQNDCAHVCNYYATAQLRGNIVHNSLVNE